MGFQEATTPVILDNETQMDEIQDDDDGHHFDHATTAMSISDPEDHQTQDDGVINSNGLFGKYLQSTLCSLLLNLLYCYRNRERFKCNGILIISKA